MLQVGFKYCCFKSSSSFGYFFNDCQVLDLIDLNQIKPFQSNQIKSNQAPPKNESNQIKSNQHFNQIKSTPIKSNQPHQKNPIKSNQIKSTFQSNQIKSDLIWIKSNHDLIWLNSIKSNTPKRGGILLLREDLLLTRGGIFQYGEGYSLIRSLVLLIRAIFINKITIFIHKGRIFINKGRHFINKGRNVINKGSIFINQGKKLINKRIYLINKVRFYFWNPSKFSLRLVIPTKSFQSENGITPFERCSRQNSITKNGWR